MRNLLLGALMVAPVLMQQANAQTRAISGRVTDRASGQGLPGVTVLVKGTTIGASTNSDGTYTINVPADATTLTFSSIGYASIERPIGTASTIDIGLANDSKQLGEVVVTGALGVQRQAKEIGYSTATVKAEELNQARVTQVTNGLAGKVSGLQVQTLSSGVNPSVRVTLRGTRSLTGNNEALIVLDGIIVPNDVLTALNPDDIDNVTVLKGANAAALYGSQATNGALIITTKKGGNTPAVTFSQTSQFEQVSFLPKLQKEFGLGSDEYEAIYTPYENQQYGPRFDGTVRPLGLPVESGNIQQLPYVARPNEREKFFDTGYQMQNNVSFSGGNGPSKIFVSFQNVKNKGVVPKDVFDRNTFRVNASSQLGKLTAGFNVSYSAKRIDQTSNSDRDNSVYWNIINTSVQVPLSQYKDWRNNEFANPNGYYNEYYRNPYFILDNSRTKGREDYVIGNIDLGYKVLDWLNVQYRLGITTINQSSRAYQDRFDFTPFTLARAENARANIPGFVNELSSYNTRVYSDLFLNINKSFGDVTVSAILGNNTQQNTARVQTTNSSALAVPGLFNLSNRIGPVNGAEADYQQRQTSVFADLTLGYKEFLFLHGSARNDWTSVLSKENRSFFYPSVDVSFIFTDAIPVLKDGSFLDYGKIRAGISKVGQVNLGNASVGGVATSFGAYALDPAFQLGSGFPFGSLTSYSLSDRIVQRGLTPEFTTSFEVGAEVAFLARRVNLAGTYYTQKSTDQTVSAGVSNATGFSSFLLNAGEVRNKGYEVDLNVIPVQLENGFTWKVGANYNYNNNEVVSIAPGINELPLTTGGNSQVYAIVGQPYPVLRGSYYTKDDQGRVIVNATPVAGHGTQYFPAKAADTKIFGNTLPKNKYGFNTSFSFKGLTLAGQAEYRSGYVVYHTIGENLDFTGASQRSAEYGREPFIYPNSSVLNADGVTYSPNTSNFTPGGAEFWANSSYNTTVAENYVTKGNFFKIRELSLNYALPATLLTKTGFIKGASLNLYGRNLFTWVPKENQWTDPEFSFTNSTSNAIGINTINQTPPTRFYGASLSATF